jgi:hypothetical protein
MAKVSIELDIKQLERIIDNLPLRDKIRLTKGLERQTLGKVIDEIFSKIDRRRKKFPISEKEIKKEIKAARKEIYG